MSTLVANNIVLVGMPGAGKSTIGRLLAEKCQKEFLDSDTLIEQKTGEALQHSVDRLGYMALREIESEVLADLFLDNCVLATGGSAVYGEHAMQSLKSQAVVVYLACDLEELRKRVDNFATRGLAKPATQTLEQLYDEREVLYRRYADATVDGKNKKIESVVIEIEGMLGLN